MNEQLTRLIRGGAIESRVNFEARIRSGIENLELMQSTCGVRIRNKCILEWGTGWHGIDIILFYLAGAREIYTFDHHGHLSYPNFRKSIQQCLEHPDMLKLLGTESESAVHDERIAVLKRVYVDKAPNSELLKAFNVHYLIAPDCSPERFNGPSVKIDIFYSNSVLQRIPESILVTNLQRLNKDWFSSDISFFHKLDLFDANALRHVDQSLWRLHYLYYSDFTFTKLISGRFNSQNRLRECEFIRLFEMLGLSARHIKSYIDREDVKRIAKHKLAARFKDYLPEELAVTHSLLAFRRDPLSQPLSCHTDLSRSVREIEYYDYQTVIDRKSNVA
ncbi:hypothetical protein [Oleiphilus messinensis]|uniref:hypothetical protein n=1 Tax=Oleiphilus messinensis TaxID=141451 RepID=UPI0012FC86D2|nr:hypothetical protein [Oleiphilus messinensis]